jgi:hypothetical protein
LPLWRSLHTGCFPIPERLRAAAAEVRRTVWKTIEEAGAGGRFWIGSTTEIHPAAKLENVLAIWDEIENYGYCG